MQSPDHTCQRDSAVVPPSPARLSDYRMLAGGQFQIRIDAEPGLNLRIDISPSLLDWIELISMPSVSGPYSFVETNALLDPKRFYRVTTESGF